jgi:hypothetical protein
MKLTRRSTLLTGVAFSAMLLAGRVDAQGILLSAVPSSAAPPPGTLITQMNLVNTGGALAAGSVTQLIGCPFKKGDMPSGQWPQFQVAPGTTTVPCTILDKMATTWSDSSLKFVPVMLQLPVAVGASGGTIVINIFNGGTLPSASARGLSDFPANTRVEFDALDNYSGTFAFNLSSGTITKSITYGNGPAGWVGKVRVKGNNGSDSTQHVCDFYLSSLANTDGSLKGCRILGKVKLPYYDQGGGGGGTQNWVTMTGLRVMYGASSVLHDCFLGASDSLGGSSGYAFGTNRAKTFTSSGSGSSFSSSHHYATTPNGGDRGYAVRLTTTGTLPTGLSIGTTYWMTIVGSGTVKFSTQSQGAIANNHFVPASSSGSGTHTWTPYPCIPYFCAIWTATANGTQDWIGSGQGVGTDAADTTLIHQYGLNPLGHDYRLSTQMIPPYDKSLAGSVASNVTWNYWPNCSGQVTRFGSTTGERDDIGCIPGWYVRHFMNQSAADLQAVKVAAMIGAQLPVGVEHSATLTLPCINNGHNRTGGTYSGMRAPNPLWVWGAGALGSNFNDQTSYTDNTDPNCQIMGFSETNTSHMCQFHYYPYLVTGEPWHLDSLREAASNGIWFRIPSNAIVQIDSTHYYIDNSGNGAARNISTNGGATYYYGTTLFSNSAGTRADDWATCLLGAWAGIGPDSDPDCASYKQYSGDMYSDTWQCATDVMNICTSAGLTYAAAYALPLGTPQNNQRYFEFIYHQLGYGLTSFLLGANLTENTNAPAIAQKVCAWADHIVATFTGWHLTAEQVTIKPSNVNGGPMITGDYGTTPGSPGGVAFGIAGPLLTWTNSGSMPFTYTKIAGTNPSPGYVISNGDIIMFVDSEGSNPHQTPDSGAGLYAPYVQYYIVGLSGSNFGLSATAGGSAIAAPTNPSSSGSPNPTQTYFIAKNPPSTGGIDVVWNNKTFNTENLGALIMAEACGLTVASGTISDLLLRQSTTYGGGGYAAFFSTNQQYAMKNTFIQ